MRNFLRNRYTLRMFRALPALVMLLVALAIGFRSDNARTFTFEDPIDALSIGVEEDTIELELSARTSRGWTAWQELTIEKEFDPLLRESNLIIFPEPIETIRVRGKTQNYALHPIKVSKDPATFELASSRNMRTPRVLTRRQWGANDAFLFTGSPTTKSDIQEDKSSNGNASSGQDVSGRVRECKEAQVNYPNDFRTAQTLEKDGQGRSYRWAQRYSPKVKLLVVHHTAMTVKDDSRPPVERMRALYQYHANNRNWGDIGYHFVIDEKGQIYEGRNGGSRVVGGHVYCSNVGTVGVALMGNFEKEQPPQVQMQSLKWLLDDLAKKYDINLSRSVRFHGERVDPIVGHKDLIATACPGFYVRETLSQVRKQTIAGNFSDRISFPRIISRTGSRTKDRRSERLRSQVSEPELRVLGSTEITGPPGSQTTFLLTYQAGGKSVSRRSRIAKVERSFERIGVWQEIDGRDVRVRRELILPETLRPSERSTIRMRVQFPSKAGAYTLCIGDITFILKAEGRRLRSVQEKPVSTVATPRRKSQARLSPDVSTDNTEPGASESSNVVVEENMIRIRLGYEGDRASISTTTNPIVNGKRATSRSIDLSRVENKCRATVNRSEIASGIVRIDPRNGITIIDSWNRTTNRFRGIIECRIIDGELTLINEIPLEDYLAGLAEEPDTELFEKQRAFAIAARSYAAHYMDPDNRKFPGKPYDGDDSPARFQMYGGVRFEEGNPKWADAVRSTTKQVVTKGGEVVKTAYFSSDDGRTRSPEENGWNGFPFAEVFVSKPDPWCSGMPLYGHGVGMSGCGARGQALEGKSAEEILEYYYPGTVIRELN